MEEEPHLSNNQDNQASEETLEGHDLVTNMNESLFEVHKEEHNEEGSLIQRRALEDMDIVALLKNEFLISYALKGGNGMPTIISTIALFFILTQKMRLKLIFLFS